MNPTQQILKEVKKAVSGKDQTLVWILMAILARGHILLEDMPGVGKTTAALAFSKALGLSFGRVQFTPDVLPSDVTGYSVYQRETGRMVYQPGAVLCNFFLADELNRATSRTQSALLEAMEEGQVTVDGNTYRLPDPFFVMATQNPTGAAGTQLLPDSQMDRFTVRLSLGYPDSDAEFEMVQNRLDGNPIDRITPVVTADGLAAMQREVSSVYIKEEVVRYAIALIAATRTGGLILRGASPRATLSLVSMAKAAAYMRGRDYVIPQDVSHTFPKTVEHRLLLAPETQNADAGPDLLLKQIVAKTSAPRL